MSQKFVAISVGVSPPTVSMWENGRKEPTRENLIKLADLFGVTIDYLLGRDNQPAQTGSHRVVDCDEAILLQIYRHLNESGKAYVRDMANYALGRDDFRQETPSESAM